MYVFGESRQKDNDVGYAQQSNEKPHENNNQLIHIILYMLLIKDKEKTQLKRRISKLPNYFKSINASIGFFQFFATFILCFGICASTYLHPQVFKIPNIFQTFIISSFLYFGLSIAGPFSGGHLNPSVTVSLVTAGIVNKNKIPIYFLSQTAGALLGGLISYLVLDIVPGPYVEEEDFGSIFLDGFTEIIGTFIFTFGIIYTTKRNYMKGQYFNYFFISLMLLLGRTFTFRKQCLNPAVGISLQLYKSIDISSPITFFYIFSIVIGSLLGGVLAAFFYTRFYEPLLNEIQEKKQQ